MTLEGIDGAGWVVGRGVGPEWRAVRGARAGAALAGLADAEGWAARAGLKALDAYGLRRSFAELRRAPEAARRRLLLFPAFDRWLAVARAFTAGGRPAEEAERHFSGFQSFAAALAALTGRRSTLKVRLTAEGRFHATGTRQWFQLPPAAAGAEAVCEARGGRLSVVWGRAAGRPALLPALTEELWVEERDPLVVESVVMHGLARLGEPRRARFVRVLSAALARIRAVEPGLFAELEDALRLIVPLENPKGHGSVSSSYRELRGALCLSHSDDVLLQEETLVHEFCHLKVNELQESVPLLKPGQGGQVVFSPLRPDARRLGGLLLGAHAFVNVNRYLLKVLRRDALPARARAGVQRNLARRLFHVDDMLRTVSLYADLTPPGLAFQARLWREHALTLHDALDIPAPLWEEGRRALRAARLKGALGETGFHAEGSA